MWVEGWGRLPGKLVVLSGPSGSGKSTLLRLALEKLDGPVRLSTSATTRPPRAGERDGVEYIFMDPTEFRDARDRGEFLEFAEYNTQFYGTPARPVFEAMARGECVVLEIEVKGALQIREKAPSALFVFVDVPHFSVLEDRLRARGTEDEPAIHRRLVRARWERDHAHCYDEHILNDNLDEAVDALVDLLRHHRCGGDPSCSKN
ncbi:MAG TPA: guanylate kinase [Isosphaeraceae bacterium]|nr:guanylate kinase [Isosphaeraceae bacterium]